MCHRQETGALAQKAEQAVFTVEPSFEPTPEGMDEGQADQKSGKSVGSPALTVAPLREEKDDTGEEREVKYWLGSQRIVGLGIVFASCSNKWRLEPLSCLYMGSSSVLARCLSNLYIQQTGNKGGC